MGDKLSYSSFSQTDYGKILIKCVGYIVMSDRKKQYEIVAVCIRNAITTILDDLLDNHYGKPRQYQRTLYFKINEIKHLASEEIYNALTKCRKVGNQAAHARQISQDDYENVISYFKQILIWYENIINLEGHLWEIQEREANDGHNIKTVEFEYEKRLIDAIIAEEQLNFEEHHEEIGVLRAYGNGLLSRMKDESSINFKKRISLHPPVVMGEALFCRQIVLESAIIPVGIKWNNDKYENRDLKYYIKISGNISKKIIDLEHKFLVTGKYTIGNNDYAIPDHYKLNLLIGDQIHEIKVINLRKSIYETKEMFCRRIEELKETPVAYLEVNEVYSDRVCGFYHTQLRGLDGAISISAPSEVYCFHSDLEVYNDKTYIVYAKLVSKDDQIACEKLEVKVGDSYITLLKYKETEEFFRNIGCIPIGEYSILNEYTDPSTGYVCISIHLTNNFNIVEDNDLPYFGWIKAYEQIEKEGTVYSELMIDNGLVHVKDVMIRYKDQWIYFYPMHLLSNINQIKEYAFEGKRIPIGYFEYVLNGFDGITGYCPIDIVDWFEWAPKHHCHQKEFYCYLPLNTNPIVGIKSFVYIELLSNSYTGNEFGVKISIGEKLFDIYVRDLNKSSQETMTAYEKRIGDKLPIANVYFEGYHNTLANDNNRLIVEKWYNGVIPFEEEIYVIIEKHQKELLLQSKYYTLFCSDSKAKNNKLAPNKNHLSLHVGTTVLEVILISSEVLAENINNQIYLDKLQYICAGHIDIHTKAYDAERSLFFTNIRWRKWSLFYTHDLRRAYLKIDAEEARDIFENYIEYEIYLVICSGKITHTLLAAERLYELSFRKDDILEEEVFEDTIEIIDLQNTSSPLIEATCYPLEKVKILPISAETDVVQGVTLQDKQPHYLLDDKIHTTIPNKNISDVLKISDVYDTMQTQQGMSNFSTRKKFKNKTRNFVIIPVAMVITFIIGIQVRDLQKWILSMNDLNTFKSSNTTNQPTVEKPILWQPIKVAPENKIVEPKNKETIEAGEVKENLDINQVQEEVAVPVDEISEVILPKQDAIQNATQESDTAQKEVIIESEASPEKEVPIQTELSIKKEIPIEIEVPQEETPIEIEVPVEKEVSTQKEVPQSEEHIILLSIHPYNGQKDAYLQWGYLNLVFDQDMQGIKDLNKVKLVDDKGTLVNILGVEPGYTAKDNLLILLQNDLKLDTNYTLYIPKDTIISASKEVYSLDINIQFRTARNLVKGQIDTNKNCFGKTIYLQKDSVVYKAVIRGKNEFFIPNVEPGLYKVRILNEDFLEAQISVASSGINEYIVK